MQRQRRGDSGWEKVSRQEGGSSGHSMLLMRERVHTLDDVLGSSIQLQSGGPTKGCLRRSISP